MPQKNRLRALRDQAGVSQAELAARTGFAKTHISKWENHWFQPSMSAALKLAAALGVHVEELFEEEQRG